MPHARAPVSAQTPQVLVLGIVGLGRSGGHIVAIDGFMGAGKTSLSFVLAELLGGFRVGLDCYVDRDKDVTDYVQKLRIAHLRRDVENLQRWFPYVVIEGIRVRDVLGELGQETSSNVYVKRVSQVGIWHDGHHLERFQDGTDVPQDWLRLEELAYHVRRAPHACADFMYERHEA